MCPDTLPPKATPRPPGFRRRSLAAPSSTAHLARPGQASWYCCSFTSSQQSPGKCLFRHCTTLSHVSGNAVQENQPSPLGPWARVGANPKLYSAVLSAGAGAELHPVRRAARLLQEQSCWWLSPATAPRCLPPTSSADVTWAVASTSPRSSCG